MVTLLAVPNDCGLALSRRLCLMLAKSRAMAFAVAKSRAMAFVIFWRGSVDFLRRNLYSMVEFDLCKTSTG